MSHENIVGDFSLQTSVIFGRALCHRDRASERERKERNTDAGNLPQQHSKNNQKEKKKTLGKNALKELLSANCAPTL